MKQEEAMKIQLGTTSRKLDYFLPKRGDPDFISKITKEAIMYMQKQPTVGVASIPATVEISIKAVPETANVTSVKANCLDKHLVMGIIAKVAHEILCQDRIMIRSMAEGMQMLEEF